MTENIMNGPHSQPVQPKEIVMPGLKPVSQHPINGLASQNLSRGSSPSLLAAHIPASQLPPSRSMPLSHQTPISSLSAVTQKVSQMNVQSPLLSYANTPQFTSTPKTSSSQNDIDLNSIPRTSSKSEVKSNVVHHNFQEIPLNEDKTVSKNINSTESDMIDPQTKNSADDYSHKETLNSPTSNNFYTQDSQVLPINFNSKLFQNTASDFSTTKSSEPFGSLQQPRKILENQPIVNQLLHNQSQKHTVFQSAASQSVQHFRNHQPISQNDTQKHDIATTISTQNIQPASFQMSPSPKGQNLGIMPTQISSASFPIVSMSQANLMSSNTYVSPKQPMPPTARPTGSNPVKQPMLPTNSNKATTRPTGSNPAHLGVIRPNFNLNPVANQSKNNLTALNQPGNIQMPQNFHSNQPLSAGMGQPMIRPQTANIQENRMSPLNHGMMPTSQDYPPSHKQLAGFQTSRYPTIPAQRVPSLPNLQPSHNQQYRSQHIQNQQYSAAPPSTYNQHTTNQLNNQYLGQNVVQQGFSKLWGTENHDLLNTVHILPPNKIIPPQIYLGNEALNAANCSGEIFRSTMTKIPESQSLLQKSRLPLGILIHPFKDLTQLSVIQCNVIVRCRACRTYINPFVFFVDSKRWKCNLCYRVNDLPEEFQYDPVSKTYGDPCRRPEIKSSTIEYIAPAEYMLRPPQPAIYLFLLDVSRSAVESGYLNIFCSVLLEELINIPGDSRTQVGFITYDSSLHFFMFAEGLSQPHEMVVLDIDDIFLPSPDNLLVNLKDRMELIKDLLNQLPARYSGTYDNNSALGSALQAAHKMMSATGGRVTVFQASLPNVGPGALTPREDPNQRASADIHNLKPANDFYKRLALDCSSQQIAVDLFIVNSQYVDIATISGISRFSGGCIHHFPLFKFGRPLITEKLEKCFRRYITRKIGFEAVMRVRCTRGMSIHTFHGNFFVRSTDLLSLPNVNPDAGYGMQVSIDENLSDVETVCFQAALLYTSSKGERRIRVHTLCLPIVSTLHDVLNSADQQCIIGLLAKMAVDRSMESSLSDAREAFINVAIDILSSYKLSLNLGSPVSGLVAPTCLKLLPLYISALLKHQAFRTGTSTRLDDRVKAMIDMKTTPLPWLMQSIYPDLYPIHNLEEQQVILNMEEESVHVPPHLQLTSRIIDNIGAYLMDTGDHMMVYVCSGVSPVFVKDGLGVPNFGMINDQMYDVPVLENQTSQRLVSFINYLNEEKPYRATVQVIKDNSPNRGVFLERLIEDRFEDALSYHEFLQHVKVQVK